MILVTGKTVLPESSVENRIMKISTEVSINEMDRADLSEDQLTSPEKDSLIAMENAPIFEKKRFVPFQSRNDRMTRVKVILPNPKTSSIQRLVAKFARAELESPKMQQTLKKLIDLHSPTEVYQERSVVTPRLQRFRENYKSSRREKNRRKRRRKRTEYRKVRKKINVNKKKLYNPRIRLIRQIENSTRTNRDKEFSTSGLHKSLGYRSADQLENFNDANYQEEPYGNLNTGINYPGVEDFDNYQYSVRDDNPEFNEAPNYSPIRNEMYNEGLTRPVGDNEDFSLSKDQPMAFDRYNLPERHFYKKIPYNENTDLNYLNNEGNPINPKRREFQNSRSFSSHNKFRNHLSGARFLGDSNIDAAKTFHPKMTNFLARNNGKKIKNIKNHGSSSSNNQAEIADYPASSERDFQINSNISRRLNDTKKTGSSLNFPSNDSTNSLSSVEVTPTTPKTTRTREPSTSKSIKNFRTRKNSKVEKSDRSNSSGGPTFASGNDSTTTETSPQSKKVNGTRSLSPEGKTTVESEHLKRIGGPRSNDTAIIKETRQVAGQILNSIIEELEDLKLNRNRNNHKEGLPCRLSGSWITTEAGVRIDMLVKNHSVNVSLAKLNFPVGIRRRSLLNYTWNTTGYAPFTRGGPFSLVAMDNRTKSLAVFVGACRVCQGVDTIEGAWTIAREPRDCRDFQMSTSIHNDIFRRTRLYSALKKKQSAASNGQNYSTSTSSSSSIRQEYLTSYSDD